MKKITMVVEMCVEVPDNAELNDLCLNFDPSLIEVEDLNMGKIPGAYVSSYETMDVIDESPET